MSLAFDTSILIAIEKKNQNTIKELKNLSNIYPAPAQLPFMSHFEFLYGLKKRKPKKLNNLIKFLNNFNVLQTTTTTSNILSNLKLKYDSIGITLSLTDLLIASQIIENHLTLVTSDNDFKNIEELNNQLIIIPTHPTSTHPNS